METIYGRGNAAHVPQAFTQTTLTQTATPVTHHYRTLPIADGFNWPHIIRHLQTLGRTKTEPLYLVVFRSVRKPGVDSAWVTQLDEAAHQEALQSPALLYYFAGHLDENRRAMSWCLWTEQTAARQALSGSAHQNAVRAARELYEAFSIETYMVHIATETGIQFVEAPRHHH